MKLSSSALLPILLHSISSLGNASSDKAAPLPSRETYSLGGAIPQEDHGGDGSVSTSTPNDVTLVNGSSEGGGASYTCRPPKEHTFLAIGQDLFGIKQYVDAQYEYYLMNEDFEKEPLDMKTEADFAPAAAMVYTDLEYLKGLSTPTEYGSGIEYADGILNDVFPTVSVALQIGLRLDGVPGCNIIMSGARDHQISLLANYIMSTSAPKVFLRVGYEFDNPAFMYTSSPEVYQEAFRYVVKKIRTEMEKMPNCDPSKVQFVWHSWAAGLEKGLTLEDFWPGKEYVDWVGISIFQQFNDDAVSQSFGSVMDIELVLKFAQSYNKPIMIAESTPFGGITGYANKSRHIPDYWIKWFAKVIHLIDRFDIGFWSYINCNWDALKMWGGKGFGQTEISSNAEVMKNWQAFVMKGESKRTFLQVGTLDKCHVDQINQVDGIDTKPPYTTQQNSPPFTTGGQRPDSEEQTRPDSEEQKRPDSHKPKDGKFYKRSSPSEISMEEEKERNKKFLNKVALVFFVIGGLIYYSHYQGYQDSYNRHGGFPRTRNDSMSTMSTSRAGIGQKGYSYIGGNDDSASYQQNSLSGSSNASVIHV